MFCKVERSYIEDGFNLYGLRACVANFSDCLDLILDRIGPDDSDDSHLTQSACTLYGLIHARYIITAHGLDAMYNKVSFSLLFFYYYLILLVLFGKLNFQSLIFDILIFRNAPHRFFTTSSIPYQPSVCKQGVRNMPTDTVLRTTSLTRRPKR